MDMVITDTILVLMYLVCDFAVGLLFMWAWGKMFKVHLTKGRTIKGAAVWSVVGAVSVFVFNQ
jgi:hypothetical protein